MNGRVPGRHQLRVTALNRSCRVAQVPCALTGQAVRTGMRDSGAGHALSSVLGTGWGARVPSRRCWAPTATRSCRVRAGHARAVGLTVSACHTFGHRRPRRARRHCHLARLNERLRDAAAGKQGFDQWTGRHHVAWAAARGDLHGKVLWGKDSPGVTVVPGARMPAVQAQAWCERKRESGETCALLW